MYFFKSSNVDDNQTKQQINKYLIGDQRLRNLISFKIF